MKVLTLRRADSCGVCAVQLEPGTRAAWDATARTVTCLACVQQPRTQDVTPLSSGPGSSALREYERRSSRREERIRRQHPRLGGLILALSDEPSSTRVWAQGAAGERAVGSKLEELSGEHVVALHDRRMLGLDGRPTRSNIDHIAVAATGVWVIDAKTHKGALEVRRSGGLFGPRKEALYIAGRDQTRLVEGLLWQVEAVRRLLADVQANVPVRGVLCFVGTELPWFGSSSIVGVPLVGRRGLGKLLKQPGDLAPEDRYAVAEYLGLRLTPA